MENKNTQLAQKIAQRSDMLDAQQDVAAITNEIWTFIHTYRAELTFESIFEGMTHLGAAPQLVYDDNGLFAVSCDGMSPVFADDKAHDMDITTYTKADQWSDTVRGALYHLLDTLLTADRD